MKMTTVEKIEFLRRRRGLKKGDLAAATGQTRQNLSNKYDRGNFSEKELSGFAEALGCELKIIFVDNIYKDIDFDKIDISGPPPTVEPDRQYYFIAKLRKYVKEKSAELGRPLRCYTETFGCPLVTA